MNGFTASPASRGDRRDQCWSAGMYIYAYMCVKEGREPVFSALESRESQLMHNTSPIE